MQDETSNQAGRHDGKRLLWSAAGLEARASYELRLRRTDRVRLVVQNAGVRESAPRHLVMRIRRSLAFGPVDD